MDFFIPLNPIRVSIQEGFESIRGSNLIRVSIQRGFESKVGFNPSRVQIS